MPGAETQRAECFRKLRSRHRTGDRSGCAPAEPYPITSESIVQQSRNGNIKLLRFGTAQDIHKNNARLSRAARRTGWERDPTKPPLRSRRSPVVPGRPDQGRKAAPPTSARFRQAP